MMIRLLEQLDLAEDVLHAPLIERHKALQASLVGGRAVLPAIHLHLLPVALADEGEVLLVHLADAVGVALVLVRIVAQHLQAEADVPSFVALYLLETLGEAGHATLAREDVQENLVPGIRLHTLYDPLIMRHPLHKAHGAVSITVQRVDQPLAALLQSIVHRVGQRLLALLLLKDLLEVAVEEVGVLELFDELGAQERLLPEARGHHDPGAEEQSHVLFRVVERAAEALEVDPDRFVKLLVLFLILREVDLRRVPSTRLYGLTPQLVCGFVERLLDRPNFDLVYLFDVDTGLVAHVLLLNPLPRPRVCA